MDLVFECPAFTGTLTAEHRETCGMKLQQTKLWHIHIQNSDFNLLFNNFLVPSSKWASSKMLLHFWCHQRMHHAKNCSSVSSLKQSSQWCNLTKATILKARSNCDKTCWCCQDAPCSSPDLMPTFLGRQKHVFHEATVMNMWRHLRTWLLLHSFPWSFSKKTNGHFCVSCGKQSCQIGKDLNLNCFLCSSPVLHHKIAFTEECFLNEALLAIVCLILKPAQQSFLEQAS